MANTPASDNEFPKLLLSSLGGAPANPSAGMVKVYSLGGELYVLQSDGTLAKVNAIEDLVTTETTVTKVLNPDGAGGVAWGTPGAFSGDAGDIPFTPVGTIAATDVQAAIAEVASEAAGGGAAVTSARVNYTAGSITLGAGTGSHTEINSALRISVAAATGDLLMAGMTGMTTAGAGGETALDIATIVSAAIVHRFGAGGSRIGLAYSVAATVPFAPTATYVVQSGDISGGNVTLSPTFVNSSASNSTLFATTTYSFLFWVVNLHH